MIPRTILMSMFGLWAGGVLALSQEDCRQISETYGLIPQECQDLSQANRSHTLAPFGNGVRPSTGARLSAPTDTMRQNNIFFQQGGANLSPEALLQVQQLATLLNGEAMKRTCIQLVGHSDSSGSNVVNWEIGAKRATAVRNRLALLVRNPNRLEAVTSKGEESPLAGITPESHWQRRVEIWARDCPAHIVSP